MHPADLAVLLQPSYNGTCVCQVKTPTKIFHTVVDGKHLRLAVERKPQLMQDALHAVERLHQIGLVRVDQDEVIHVASIVLDPALLLDISVEFIKVPDGEPLAGLVAEGNTFAGGDPITVDDIIQQFADTFVPEYSEKLFFQYLMVDIVEKLADIAFKDVALRPVVLVMLMEKGIQPVHCKMGALVDPTGGIIIDHMGVEPRSEQIITKAMLHDAVDIVQSIDLSYLGIVNGEVVIPALMIGAVHQPPAQIGYIAKQVCLERDYFRIAAFAETGDFVRFHQVVKGKDLFEAKHVDLTVAGGR